MIWFEFKKLTFEKEKEKLQELYKRFKEIMPKLNLENIWNKDKGETDEEQFESICKRYVDRLEEINQEFVANELFLFSIMTGRIKTAKVFWKRGKVR